MKKKVLSVVLSIVTILSLTAGCGQKGENQAKNTINVLVESGSPAEVLANNTAADFEAQTGCKVIVDAIAYTGMYDKLATEIKAKASAHDVACMDFVWLAAFADAIEPLENVDTSDFLPTLEESGTVNGKLLGYPMWVNVKTLIYRKDLIPEDKVPKTWDEYQKLSKEISTPEMYGTTVFGNGSDALSIHDNFIAECGNCIELRGWGQASKVTENLIGAGYNGYSIYAQNFGGLLVSANNVFPRGASSIYFESVTRSVITANRLHSFYPGMLIFEKNCSENLISSNHFLRDSEPWLPMKLHDNGLNDLYGLLYVSGNHNSIISNHISVVFDDIRTESSKSMPIIIHIVSGKRNYISANNIISVSSNDVLNDKTNDSCFAAQVNALLTVTENETVNVVTVLVEKESTQNIILDSGTKEQVVMDKKLNAFRATPGIEG